MLQWAKCVKGIMIGRFQNGSQDIPSLLFMSCKFFVLDVSGTCDPEDVTPGLDYSIWSGWKDFAYAIKMPNQLSSN